MGKEKPKIRISIGLGDLYDRLSILKLKQKRLRVDLKNSILEIQNGIQQYKRMGITVPTKYITAIKNINKRIWSLEDKIRNGKLSELDIKEVGMSTIKIRKLNRERAKLRNTINRESGTGYEEPY